MWKKFIAPIIVILLFILFIPYSLPFIFALITAVLLEGLVSYFQRKLKLSRVKAVIASFLSFLLAIVVLGYNLFLIIFQQVIKLSESTPTFVKDLYASGIKPLIKRWQQYSQTLPPDVISSVEKTIEESVTALDRFVQGFVQILIGFLTAIPGFLIEFLIYLVALFLFSLELPSIKAAIKRHLREETKKKVSIVLNQLTKAGVGFIKAQIFLSLITYALAFIGLLILDVKYAALLSLLIVIVDILPILGTGSFLVPWAVLSFIQDNSFLGIGLIILFVVITVVRRIVEPKVYATNLGISPLASLISLYIGFQLLGFIGLFAGPAIVIVFNTLIKVNVIKMNFKL
ncbi:sporulation integral membrane protein YtvI [Bacillus sp. FJAT-27225]|uniref:sporulation integral membrane protein YtvI n=1 Tax=Bacillus sp. FJAT-27225 TaxID=1743144 RepID=UPI00080C2EB2|nr:sporulation integral membrane protein YtvI [Bacillus sp. FJAT-27225]OCA85665.1 sporulation integral membrane protein YtvI [Bacillus sp. FJAT-27225]